MDIYQVDPSTVGRRSPTWTVSERDWRHQADRLESEGQIEPIEVVDQGEDSLIRYRIAEDAWAYAEAQVIAAIELRWPTILVTH